MAHFPVDASKSVTFDLARGQVRRADGAPSVVVPAAALARLCEAAGVDAMAALGRSLGEAVGQRILSRFEASAARAVRDASVEAIVAQLAFEVALLGMGSLSAERWGRALVLLVDHAPLEAGGDALVSSMLGAAISVATATEARCVRLDRDGVRARFLVTGQRASEQVASWLATGMAWGEALVRLHGPSNPGGAA